MPTDSVAAAATTLVYQKTYGSNDDNDHDNEDYESGSVVDVSSGNEDYSDKLKMRMARLTMTITSMTACVILMMKPSFLIGATLKTKLERHFRRTPTASISVVLRDQT